MEREESGIELAVRATATPESPNGSQEALAQKLGVSQQAVSEWVRRGWVPLKRAVEIEMLLGVPRAQLVNPRVLELIDAGDAEGGGV